MRGATIWRLPLLRALAVGLMGAVVFSGLGCASGEKGTPTPTPTPQVTPAPAPGGEEAIAAGRTLFLATGCAFCHGADARGTAQAPALAGLSRDTIVKQVRGGGWKMPAFGTDRVSDEELDKVAAFLESLK